MNGYITIQTADVRELRSCICGEFPALIIPDDHYTDCWLKCPKCGRRTENTGGYWYAHEIPLQEAKQKAIELWNKGATYIKD